MTKPDNKVQQIISIFGKKKCNCGCNGNHDNGSAVAPMGHNLITGSGFPTEDTAGNLGDYYRDELSNRTFECVDITEEYEGINGQEIAQVSDGEDISYINIASLNEGDYAALTAGVQVNNLYQLQNGELIEIPFEQVANENDVYFSADIKHVVCINSGNNMYYIYTPAETFPAYHWTATEHRTIDLYLNEEMSYQVGYNNNLLELLYSTAEYFKYDLQYMYTGDMLAVYDVDDNYLGSIEATKNIEAWFNDNGEFFIYFEYMAEYFIPHPAGSSGNYAPSDHTHDDQYSLAEHTHITTSWFRGNGLEGPNSADTGTIWTNLSTNLQYITLPHIFRPFVLINNYISVVESSNVAPPSGEGTYVYYDKTADQFFAKIVDSNGSVKTILNIPWFSTQEQASEYMYADMNFSHTPVVVACYKDNASNSSRIFGTYLLGKGRYDIRTKSVPLLDFATLNTFYSPIDHTHEAETLQLDEATNSISLNGKSSPTYSIIGVDSATKEITIDEEGAVINVWHRIIFYKQCEEDISITLKTTTNHYLNIENMTLSGDKYIEILLIYTGGAFRVMYDGNLYYLEIENPS